jgi:exodeoxyribonuclease VII large subunit
MEQLELKESGPATFTVSELTAAIHHLLSHTFEDVRVAGEISGWKVWTSGHAYFTLKDAGASLKCVMFRGMMKWLRFRPGDGLAVVARGSVEVRAERGEYQLIVSRLEPEGQGALQLAFEQLKKKLEAEGLFAAERKRPLPPFPRRIGIVTSPKGAVIRDMLNVLGRRWPGLHVRLYPTQVQGEGAVEGVCAGLRHFSEHQWADVVIVGRGGGSIEDLWTFNEEAVARAIAASSVPVVSAVGHETDFTIADFVADLRAPTPSAAAELVVRNQDDVLAAIEAARRQAVRAIDYRLTALGRRLSEQGVDRAAALLHRRVGRLLQRVDELEYTCRTRVTRLAAARAGRWQELDTRLRGRDPRVRLARARARLEAAAGLLPERVKARIEAAGRRVELAGGRLQALSPLGVLDRGYAIVQNESGQVVRAPGDAPVGSEIRVRVRRGRLSARVESGQAE